MAGGGGGERSLHGGRLKGESRARKARERDLPALILTLALSFYCQRWGLE